MSCGIDGILQNNKYDKFNHKWDILKIKFLIKNILKINGNKGGVLYPIKCEINHISKVILDIIIFK